MAVAELLSMKIPNSYEVLFPESPARAGIEPKKGETEGPGECGRKTPWDLRGMIPMEVLMPSFLQVAKKRVWEARAQKVALTG